MRPQTAKPDDAGIGPDRQPLAPEGDKSVDVAVGLQSGDARLLRRPPRIGRLVIRIAAVPGRGTVSRRLRGNAVDDEIHHRAQATTDRRLRPPRQGLDGIARAEPRVETVMIGGQKQIAGGTRPKRWRNDHRAEPHRRDPVEVLSPFLDRPGQ